MTHIITIEHNQILYEAFYTQHCILRINRIFNDSGIEREVPFDLVPSAVQERIKQAIQEVE